MTKNSFFFVFLGGFVQKSENRFDASVVGLERLERGQIHVGSIAGILRRSTLGGGQFSLPYDRFYDRRRLQEVSSFTFFSSFAYVILIRWSLDWIIFNCRLM